MTESERMRRIGVSLSILLLTAQTCRAQEYQQGWPGYQNGPQGVPNQQYMQAPASGPAAPMLQGGVQQSFMTGAAQQTGLTGGASGWGWQGNAQQGRADQQKLQGNANQWPGQPLQGNVTGNAPMSLSATNDPDGGQLDIEWDKWRNTLIQTIQAGVVQKINVHDNVHFVWDPRTQMMQSRYPNGTSAWYSLDVLPNRSIINIRLTQSSRFPSYDQAVIQAINDLQGNHILKYPKGSKRQIVTQEANVSTAAQSSTQTFQFGDVERQRY